MQCARLPWPHGTWHGTYMLERDRCCAQGNHQGEEARAGEEHDCEVEVMHATEEGRARRRPDAAARAKGELGNKARQAHQQAPDQSPEGALQGEDVSLLQCPCPALPQVGPVLRLTFSLTRGTKSASTKTADTGGAR